MKNGRLLWPDILKIISILGVILIHCSAPMLVSEALGGKNWWLANIYDSMVRWCVPVFFMVSGAFIIEKAGSLSPGQFFLKRSQKIVVPFIIWSALYFLWRIHKGENLKWLNFPAMLLEEPIYYHLWFIYVLIGLYIIAPVLGAYVKGASRKNQSYLLFLWFITASLLPMLQNCCKFHTFFFPVETVSVLKFSGYFFLGYFLRDTKPKAALMPVFFLLYAIGFLITTFGTYYLSLKTGNESISELLYEYYTVNVLAMSVSVYLIVKSIPFPLLSSTKSPIAVTAACVPGVYFVHAFVIAVFKQGLLGFTFSERSLTPAIGIPVFTLAVFTVSLLITQILRLIPVLKCSIP